MIASAFLPALAGCSVNKAGDVQLSVPAVVDYAEVRCPPLDATIKNEFKRTTERPEAWQQGPAKSGELMAHVDALELGEARKNGYGEMAVKAYERCRRGGPAPAPKVKPPPTS